jgi:hypothetical protein
MLLNPRIVSRGVIDIFNYFGRNGDGQTWHLADGDDPDLPSNRFRFSSKLLRDAVSVRFSSGRDCSRVGLLDGDGAATGVTVTVFSVRQVFCGTSGFTGSGVAGLAACVTKVLAGFGGPSGSALARTAASAAF